MWIMKGGVMNTEHEENASASGRPASATGQRVTIACTSGELVIEAPRVRGVSFEAITAPRAWIFNWATTTTMIGKLSRWTERVAQLDTLHGVACLRRTALLLRAGDHAAALEEAERLPEPYMPIWTLIQAEAVRRG
jgi:hypothetical protein